MMIPVLASLNVCDNHSIQHYVNYCIITCYNIRQQLVSVRNVCTSLDNSHLSTLLSSKELVHIVQLNGFAPVAIVCLLLSWPQFECSVKWTWSNILAIYKINQDLECIIMKWRKSPVAIHKLLYSVVVLHHCNKFRLNWWFAHGSIFHYKITHKTRDSKVTLHKTATAMDLFLYKPGEMSTQETFCSWPAKVFKGIQPGWVQTCAWKKHWKKHQSNSDQIKEFIDARSFTFTLQS